MSGLIASACYVCCPACAGGPPTQSRRGRRAQRSRLDLNTAKFGNATRRKHGAKARQTDGLFTWGRAERLRVSTGLHEYALAHVGLPPLGLSRWRVGAVFQDR